MKRLSQTIAVAAILTVVVSAFAYTSGSLSLDASKGLLLVATVVWFAAAIGGWGGYGSESSS